jgi:hypothetical protein
MHDYFTHTHTLPYALHTPPEGDDEFWTQDFFADAQDSGSEAEEFGSQDFSSEEDVIDRLASECVCECMCMYVIDK